MNGTKPKFLKKSALNPEYFKEPNPYMNAPSCHVNLLKLSRYAKKHRKKLIDLTQDYTSYLGCRADRRLRA